jgi:tight adherence protein C
MNDLIEMLSNPQLLATMFAAIAAFATVLSLALPMLQRDRVNQRMKVMALERDKMRAVRLSEMAAKDRVTPGSQAKLRQSSKGYMQQVVDKLDLRKQFDSEELRAKLKMAGLSGQAPVVTYMFCRVAVPPLAFLIGLGYFFLVSQMTHPPAIKALMALGCGFLGYYLPNVFVQNLVSKRQLAVKQAFPDCLDMLLICVQSGMSVEAAFGKVAREITSQSIEMGEELSLTTAELSYLPERRLAYENLGKRTGLPGVKAVVTALIQAERYGTPISSALRVMAKENREIRMSEAEKKAASLPPKLTVPMIVFFLPVLFLVILGPAAIRFWGYA